MTKELIFIVEEDLDGGYTAQALGESIFTEADDIETLKLHFSPHSLFPIPHSLKAISFVYHHKVGKAVNYCYFKIIHDQLS